MKKLIGKLPKIKIDPNKMDYIEIGGGGSRKFQYIFCGIIILTLLITKLLFASELTIDETKKQLNGNPYKIAQWMAQNIKSTHEDIFYAQQPEYLFKWRKGDCEDWAILSRYFLGDKYETHLVVWCGKFREDSKYYGKIKNKISHCVLAVKIDESHWGIIDQDRYIFGGKSLADIIKMNCNIRRVKPIEAFIMDLYRFRRKKIKEIDLEE